MFAPPAPDERVITWRIEWEGKSYTWDDLTVGHLALVALLSGEDSWETLDPRFVDPTSGYMAAAYLLTAFLAQERVIDDMSDVEASDVMASVYAEVGGVKASALADAVHDV
jgi:hypothetical protein